MNFVARLIRQAPYVAFGFVLLQPWLASDALASTSYMASISYTSSVSSAPGPFSSGQAACNAANAAVPSWPVLVYQEITWWNGRGCYGIANNAFYVQVTRLATCPSGGTLASSGGPEMDQCVNAPDCPTGQTRDFATGQCALPPKNNGAVCQANPVGNPINPGVGNKYQTDTDYRSSETSSLAFERSYNAGLIAQNNPLGAKWRSSFDRAVTSFATTPARATISRPDGKSYVFTLSSAGSYQTDADVTDTLVRLTDAGGNPAGWRYTLADSALVEDHDADGKLLSLTPLDGNIQTLTYSNSSTPASIAPRAGLLIGVTDKLGRHLAFTYDVQGRIIRLTDPAGNQYLYEYDGPSGPVGANNLTAVTYPDGAKKIYWYNEPANINGGNACPSGSTTNNLLTGITDENGARYATYQYDCQGRAINEYHAGSVAQYALSYQTDASGNPSTTVTDPLGTPRSYIFQTILGVVKTTGMSQPGGAGCGPAAQSITYDANGNVASRRDFNGKKSLYSYDLARNLEVSRTEGLDSSGAALPETRTLTTAWHPTWRLPLQVEEFAGASASGTPLRRSEYRYDEHANLVQKTLTDPVSGSARTWSWSYTYSSSVPGLVLRKIEDGPRTDVADLTTYDYYDETDPCLGCRGNLKQLTNPAGQVTRYTRYNARGQLEELTDPSGLTTTLTYDLRARLTSRSAGSQTTTYRYDPAGQLIGLTQPDGATLSYTYDPAHRLIGIADGAGNKVSYTLDAAGHRLGEQLTDPGGQLAKSLTRAYDALGRLQTLTGLAAD